jgi:hypothetical protein
MKLAEMTWLEDTTGPVGLEIRELLGRVDRFCKAKSWTHGYFGKHVAGDDTLVGRLADTGKVQARLILRIEAYLSENEETVEGFTEAAE